MDLLSQVVIGFLISALFLYAGCTAARGASTTRKILMDATVLLIAPSLKK